MNKTTYENPEDQKLVEEIAEKVADSSEYKSKDDVDVEIQECPSSECDNTEFQVFQCNTGIWEVWAKCPKCGAVFCLGTE